MTESASTTPASRAFPTDFVWGAATSSFQIEGASDADGKSESIWDRFCATPGTIIDGTDGTRACDHYNRVADDVALMVDLGLTAYRFSIAWPRVVPGGTGEVNAAGLDFYDRLVDELLAAGITPYPTLYHWDLPQVLQDQGGWTNRATAEAFADYAAATVRRLGDRVTRWTTVNEPYVIANLGYLTGEHAPGHRDLDEALAASHHVLLAHGMALRAIKEIEPSHEVGVVINFTPVTPVGDSPFARERQQIVNEFENRWYSDPIAGRGYPAFATERLGWDQAEVLPGDLDLIAQPVDFFGINFYTRKFVAAIDGERGDRGDETAMGWEIHPPALGDLLRFLDDEYDFPKLLITENGAAMPDTERDADGRVADHDRIAYLRGHLEQVAGAIEQGVPIEGYFAWSLLDNFEWAWGYGPKFGIVEVDPDSLERRPKRSALWYADLIRSGSLPTD
ncbi:beta-glucosidase [Ilumatobacter fluminis]|uniref:Beta-glucosidase n=1 Tax=Ilumatobacter fluminis TaxID=467091 RepID=A0A4R7I4D9_9ACTN|nr:GH1 family beta-glucosidase [Ilumatobacter fluminis]TDT17566.1 beta-glucosidase [Ilumatobacter fluminis]